MNTKVIYKIACKDLNKKEVYIGSTKNFIERYNAHKRHSKYKTVKLYKYIRNNGGFDNFDMTILESFDNISNKDLFIKETKYIRFMGSLNCSVPCKDEISFENEKKYKKEWTIKNKEEKRLYDIEYRKKRYKCECGSNVMFYKKNRHFKSKKHINFIKNKKD